MQQNLRPDEETKLDYKGERPESNLDSFATPDLPDEIEYQFNTDKALANVMVPN